MNIRSAEFVKGVVAADELLENKKTQIAFIGRSNVGKSSVINSLTKQKNLARTSSFPGKTREINLFLINKSHYFVDLPGYGFAKVSAVKREEIFRLIYWYLFDSGYKQKFVVLIIDANVGVSEKDLKMLRDLEYHKKKVIVVANKIDKIKKNEVKKQLEKIQEIIGDYKIIPYSSDKRIGINDLTREILD